MDSDTNWDLDYMVRAVKLERTGSGSFLNPSQGIFESATWTEGPLQIATSELEEARLLSPYSVSYWRPVESSLIDGISQVELCRRA